MAWTDGADMDQDTSCGHGHRMFVSAGPQHADGGCSDEGTRERGSCVHRGAVKHVGVGGNASDGGQNVSGHVNEGWGHVLHEYGTYVDMGTGRLWVSACSSTLNGTGV